MSGYYFLKGVGVGVAVGFTVGMVISPRGLPRGKTKFGRAVRSFGDIVDTVANTITS